MKSLRLWNLLGVVLLSILCATQWRANSRLDHERHRLEERVEEQNRQAEILKAASDRSALDLAELKRMYTQAASDLAATTVDLDLAGQHGRRLELQLHEMRLTLTNWMAAVRARDLQIRDANQRLAAFTNSTRP